MKKLCLMSFAVLLMAITMFSCTQNDNTADTTAAETENATVIETSADTELTTDALITEDVTEEVTEPLTTQGVTEELTTEEETTAPLPLPTEVSLPSNYSKANFEYECDDGSVLHTFKRKNTEDYTAVCDYYSKLGFEVYSSIKQDENLATTFVGKSVMAHVYYTAFSSELNIVLSDTAADTLPTKTPEVTDGNYKCTITQIMDDENLITCGMGYVIQLEDGSFIIYDGSYATQAPKLMQCLLDLHEGEGKPIIRAWVLTHSHNDHYPTFEKVANDESYLSQITVEHVIVSQLNDEKFNLNNAEIAYLSTKFYDDVALFGSEVVFAHTGMNFAFCNLNMEILFAPESIYKNMNSVGNLNDTSIVSRLYDGSYSAIFTGDMMEGGSDFLLKAYSADYLKSDICQVAHHGVYGASFDYILEFYDAVRSPIMFYPASAVLYEHKDVRAFSWAFEEKEYIKEILLQGVGQFTREWGTTIDEDAELSIPNFTPKNPRPQGVEVQVDTLGATKPDWGLTVTANPSVGGARVDYHFKANASFNAFSPWLALFSASRNLTAEIFIYSFDTDRETTLAGEPIQSWTYDSDGDGWKTFTLDKTLPAGEYIVEIAAAEKNEKDFIWYKYVVDGGDPKGIVTSTFGNGGGEDTSKAILGFKVTFTEKLDDGNYFGKVGSIE